MSKIKVQVDARRIVDEVERLIDGFVSQYSRPFSESFPELYWAVYVPAKNAVNSKRRNYEIKQITGELFYGICRRCKLIVTGQYRDVKKRMMLHSCEEADSNGEGTNIGRT